MCGASNFYSRAGRLNATRRRWSLTIPSDAISSKGMKPDRPRAPDLRTHTGAAHRRAFKLLSTIEAEAS